MKKKILLGTLIGTFIFSSATSPAAALSCLPVDMYLDHVVGDENTVVLIGTVTDQIEEKDHTSEVLTVTEVKQGYAEEQVFVYHRKDETWGYLCNSGPKEKGAESVYIATRDSSNQLQVAQRLDLDDPLVATLTKKLADEDITGTLASSTPTDHKSQLISIINNLIAEIKSLIQQYSYWNK